MCGWVLEGDHLRFIDDLNIIKVIANLLTSMLDKQGEQSSAIAAQAGTSDGMCVLTENDMEMFIAIASGDSLKLRSLLEQVKIPVNEILLSGTPLVEVALTFRQIGIARILIKEYSLEINTGCIRIFVEHGGSESEVIDLITEFNIYIDPDFIFYALQCKCFEIVKFAVEKCGFNVNSVLRPSENDKIHGTLLHMAYYMNETAFAEYLISKGADKNATDTKGLKPMEYSGGIEAVIKYSENMAQFRQMGFQENMYYIMLRNKEYSEVEAIKSVVEKFPTLRVEAPPKRNLNDVPALKELNRYIIDMAPFYFDIGLELDVLNSQLKLIRNDPSLPDLKEKCRRMLEVWLENDTSATWKKLCDALLETGQNVLADQIKLA